MTFAAFYRCDICDVRWSWIDGRHCWMCGTLGKGTAAFSITATDDHLRDIDNALMPEPSETRLMLP